MLRNRRSHVAIAAVLILGLAAVVQHWIAARRPVLSDLKAALEFPVTSTGDHGPGTLRDAIFAADTARAHARIVFHVDHVDLTSSLPPLLNPLGILLEGSSEGVELHSSGVGSGPILDVNSPGSALRRIRVLNAPEQGILVRSMGFHLADAEILGCDVGLLALQGAGDIVIERTKFEKNRIGVRLDATVSGVLLKEDQFHAQEEAGLWAVRTQPVSQSAPDVIVKQTSFDGNRFGVVIGNTPALIEDNQFVGSREAAVFLIGQGAKVQGNRIRNGAGIGVFADGTESAVVEGNELDHNRTIGVLVRYSRDALIQNNRVYANGYGIAFVLGQTRRPSIAAQNTLLDQIFDGVILIGDSPVLRRNQLIGNRQAGLRILDFSPRSGEHVASDPYLEGNVLSGNQPDRPVHGEYPAKQASE